jgi:hypothetical protein
VARRSGLAMFTCIFCIPKCVFGAFASRTISPSQVEKRSRKGSWVGRDRWARRVAIRTDGPAVRPHPRRIYAFEKNSIKTQKFSRCFAPTECRALLGGVRKIRASLAMRLKNIHALPNQ